MRAVIAQELDVAVTRLPLVVVDDDGVGRAVSEGQEFLEHGADRGDVRLDGFVGQLGPRSVLAGGVADLGGGTAHQHDGLATGLLEAAQHHDGDEVADVQRRRGGVEADVAGDDPCGGGRVELGRVGDLMDIAAQLKGFQEVGLEGGLGHRIRLGLGGKGRVARAYGSANRRNARAATVFAASRRLRRRGGIPG